MITREQVIEILKNYEDPELLIDILTLGLIYDIKVKSNKVEILLTLTSPLCPFGPQMVDGLTQLIKEKGAEDVKIKVTFEPPWKPTEELREMLGL